MLDPRLRLPLTSRLVRGARQVPTWLVAYPDAWSPATAGVLSGRAVYVGDKTTAQVEAMSDQLRGATDEIHQLNWTRWLEFCRAPGHCTEEEVQSLLDHAAAHDHYTPLREHFSLLEAAGFIGCDCVWRNLIWGIVTCERPE